MVEKHLITKKVNNIFGNYWIVYNSKKNLLGTFSYDRDWKCLTWKQSETIRMSTSCLNELIKAMNRRELYSRVSMTPPPIADGELK